MLTPWEFDRLREQQALALKAAQPPTPQHAAAAAANEYAGDVEENAEAQRRRSRVQHALDPYLGDDDGCETDEIAVAGLGKRFNQAYDVPDGYPVPGRVGAGMFRRGPIVAGEAAYAAGYAPDACPVPVPSAAITASAIRRPLITDGQAAPCAAGGSSC